MYNTVDETTATSNLPLRGGKATMYEGGTRVPLVVSWPGHIQPASQANALVNSCDFYPTLLDLMEIKNRTSSTLRWRQLCQGTAW